MKRAPAFWWHVRPNAAARLLQPAGSVYGSLTARRMARPGTTLPVPVVCVGNLVVGGAGKTPTALALGAILSFMGQRPAVLSRGYGRRVDPAERKAVLRVDPAQHRADEVGDEPLLLAAVAPTYVSADRRAAGQRAVAEGASVLLLDDGLQNPQLAKTLTFAVVDAATGVGNGLCLPAGPLRAPVARQWSAVDAVVLIGEGVPGEAIAAEAARCGRPVFGARLVPDRAAVADLAGMPLVAFAGIGRPEKFFDTLRAAGLTLAETVAFPDHHAFSDGDGRALQARAAAAGARLVTTSKDKVRLPADVPAAVLPVSLAFDDPQGVFRLLAGLLGRAGHEPDPRR